MANTPDNPNILFFFPDQLRFDWTGGNPDLPVRTPNLDRLRGEGATFTRAICPSPLCAPCRAALASGKEYDRCGVPSNNEDYPLDRPTFYRLLRDAGYHVLGCGKFDLNKGACTSRQRAWGLDGKRFLDEWGFSDGINNEGKMDGARSGRETPQGPYLKYLEDRGLRQLHIQDFDSRKGKGATFPTPLPDEAYCDNWIGQNGLDLINSAPSDRPWFLQINFTGPHSPWDITERMAERYRNVAFPPPHHSDQLSPETHQEVRRNYSAMVENIDRWVGLYLEELERRDEHSNTLIVFSSDHGEMLGDHNRWGKGDPYHPSLSVPLVVSGPGVCAETTCDLPTTILDLSATFLDTAGVSVLGEMDSRSLGPLLKGRTDGHRTCVKSGLRDWRLVYDGRYKLVRGWEGKTALFDLERDPLETENRIEDPVYSDHLDRLSEYIAP